MFHLGGYLPDFTLTRSNLAANSYQNMAKGRKNVFSSLSLRIMVNVAS